MSQENFQRHVQELSNAAYDESGALGPLMGVAGAPTRQTSQAETLMEVLAQSQAQTRAFQALAGEVSAISEVVKHLQ